MSPRSALAALLSSAFHHCRANESGALCGTDPEHVHQMRVALRRMRSALRTFPGRASKGLNGSVRADLRRLAHALGDVRDVDVLIARIAGDGGALGHTERERLGAHLNARRALLRARLVKRLRSHAHARLMMRLALWLGAAQAAPPGPGLRRVARSRLEAGHRKSIRGAACLPAMLPDALHAWRLAIKRARYAAEFFAGLFDAKATKRYAASLARLQDLLGELTDINTAEALLRDVDLAPASIEALLRSWRPDAGGVAARLAAAMRECEACSGYWRRD
jgi:CHAD domain-containing protein